MPFKPGLTEVTIYTTASDYDRSVTVDIYVVGGGTPGEKYPHSAWGYRVIDAATNHVVISGEDYYTGYGAEDHLEAAISVLGFLDFDGQRWTYVGEDEDLIARVENNNNDKETDK